ncbi:MAG: hypothetical protein MO852_10510, partial [Candidatus Devosia euplotis]|nr:hypothetical protein [Candidatus Devosia euplotis]
MAAGLLGMGSVIAGSSEVSGRHREAALHRADADGIDLRTAVIASLEELKAARRKVPGLGHPQHSDGDPRANRLLEIADEMGVSGKYVGALRLLAKHAPRSSSARCRSMFPAPFRQSCSMPAGRSKHSRRRRSWR